MIIICSWQDIRRFNKTRVVPELDEVLLVVLAMCIEIRMEYMCINLQELAYLMKLVK